MTPLDTDTLITVGLVGLALNAVWEVAQLRPLYTCWERWSPWQRVLCPLAAVLGDGVAVVAVAWAGGRLVGAEALTPPGVAGWLVLLGLALPLGVLLERAALALDLWRYRPAMPTARVFGRDVGLAPVAQITVLPALSVALATM